VLPCPQVNDLLAGVLSGFVKTRPLYQATAPDDSDCTAVAAALESSGDIAEAAEDEDMGDMMAEILAEEAKARKALEDEVKAEAAAADAAKADADAAAAKDAAKKKKKKKAAKKKKAKKDNDL